MPFPSPTASPILSSASSLAEYPTMDNTQRLPPIQALLQHQDVLVDQIGRLSTGSCSTDSEDEYASLNHQTLPPINQITSEPYEISGRRLSQISSHFHPYAPASPPASRSSRRSRRGSPISDSDESRNPKAIREQKAREKQIVEFSRLQRTLRNQNPHLENEWTPLKSNNITDIDDPLKHNKIDVLVSSTLMHQDHYGMLLNLVQFLHEAGHESKAREVTIMLNKAGSRFDRDISSL